MFNKIKNTFNSTKKNINDSVDSLNKTIHSTKKSINDSFDSTIDSVKDAKDTVSSTIETVSEQTGKLISNFIGLSFIGANIGIVVSAIVAPVPTLIGAAIIWLMADYIENILNGIEEKNDNKKRSRIIEKLKKYGVIPQTAKIKNDYLDMTISSETGEITGTILKGSFKKEKIEELDIYDIQSLMNEIDDKDTLELLNALMSFKKNKNKLKPKIQND